MNLTIILGNQLFPSKYYKDSEHIFMSEDFGLCTHFKYHKHKLIFFLASMRNYRDQLLDQKKDVHYYELENNKTFMGNLKYTIKNLKTKKIIIYEIEDKFFEYEIEDFCRENNLELEIKKSPLFII